MAYYNPIVRTFCRLRSALIDLGIEPRAITPRTPLAMLDSQISVSALRSKLYDCGLLEVPSIPEWDARTGNPLTIATLLVVLIGGLYALASFGASAVFLIPFAVALIPFVWWLEHRVIAKPASRLDEAWVQGLGTVGHLTIWLTHFGTLRESGYQFTRNEISLKVRMIVAHWLHIPIEEIREETLFVDLTD